MDLKKIFIFILLSFFVSYFTLKIGYLSIGIFIIVLLLLYFFSYPKLAFYLIFFTRPVIDMFWELKFKYGISPLYIIGALVPLLIIIYLITHRKNIFSVKSVSLILLFFLSGLITYILNLIRFPESMWPSTIVIAKTVSAFSIMFITPFLFSSEKDIKRLLDVIFLSAISAYLSTLIAYLFGYRGVMSPGEHSNFYLTAHGILRISGVYEGTFNLAYFSLFVLLIGFFRRSDYFKNNFRTFFVSIYFLVALFFLYKTYVRTAWGIVALSVFLYFIFKKKYHMIFFAATIFAILYVSVPAISYRMWDVVEVIKGNLSFRSFGGGRGMLWEMHWHQFKALPLVSRLFGARHVGNPENQMLFLLEYFGIVGFTVYHLIMFYYVYLLFKGYRKFQEMGDYFFSEFLLFALILHIDFFTLAGIGAQQFMMINSQWIVYSLVAVALYHAERVIGRKDELLRRGL